MWHSKIVPHFAVVLKGLKPRAEPLEHPLEWGGKLLGTSCFHVSPSFTDALQETQMAEW